MSNNRRFLTPAVPRLLLALVASLAAMGLEASEPARAKLLLNIVVDGLDADYLDLLRDQLGEGGFKRLQRTGAFIPNADFGTSMDATAATALLMTGAAPSLNGVSAAEYYHPDKMRILGVFADDKALGNFTTTPYSPAALRVSNLSDEVRVASGGTNYAYAVAATPGQAISMGGHNANSTMWLDYKTGNWASSTAYKDMPTSVSLRNRKQPLTARMDTMSWTPSVSFKELRFLPDHLRRYPFRYVFPASDPMRLELFGASPLLNREINALATDLVSSMRLGTHDDVTDVLSISYQLQPYNFGKNVDNRPELVDAYIKLDRYLEQLFKDVDRRVGLENTVVMLAGTPPRRQSRREEGEWAVPAGEFSTRKAISLLNIYLMAVYGNGEYVSAYHQGHFFLNHRLLKEKGLAVEDVRRQAAGFLGRMTGVDRVFTIDQVMDGRAGENGEAMRRNNTHTTSGDLLVSFAPGFEVIDDYNIPVNAKRIKMVEKAVATTAPVFIMAHDVEPQTIGTTVDARAVAPTVARILRIRSPNGAAQAPIFLQRTRQ